MKIKKPIVVALSMSLLAVIANQNLAIAGTPTKTPAKSQVAVTASNKHETITATPSPTTTSSNKTQVAPAKKDSGWKELLCTALLTGTSMMAYTGAGLLFKLGLAFVGSDIIYRNCSK